MTTVYLSLGSNVGDSRQHVATAIKLLGTVLDDVKQAPLYLSKAVGYTDQADFLNTALSGKTTLTPEKLLAAIKSIEQQVGRVQRFRWGPREIDIDIILYGDLVSESPELTIPHPQFRARDFVLRPLSDLDPTLTDPATGLTITQLLAKIAPEETSILRKVDETG